MNPSPDPTRERIERLRRMRARAGGESAGAAESTDGDGGELPASAPDIKRYADQTRDGLRRIVRDYLGADPALYAIADDLAARAEQGLTALRTGGAEALEGRSEFVADFEAVIRADGSRPSFLIRDGIVDRNTSPLGTWGPYLDDDADALLKAVAAVGRVDNPTNIQAGYDGTGFLVAPNLILTNRHVLQEVGWKGDDGAWKLTDGVTIDFGREFRARDSVGPRKFRRVAFAGKDVVDTDRAVDHAVLDLAAIELEPGDAPPTAFEVDVSPDWAAGAAELYTIGYPFRPKRGVYTPNLMEKLFQTTFGYKRLAPGVAARSQRSTQKWTAAHDATTLGGNSGSVVVVAGRPVLAAGLHYGGSRTEPAENWGHILGCVLDATDDKGRKLRDVFQEFGVVFRDRAVAPPAGSAGDPEDGVNEIVP